jgi:hypothetical protein
LRDARCEPDLHRNIMVNVGELSTKSKSTIARTGIGKSPSNCRNIICCRASVVMDCNSSSADGRESRCSRKPYTPDSPKRVNWSSTFF